jgi:hypothetical protein
LVLEAAWSSANSSLSKREARAALPPGCTAVRLSMQACDGREIVVIEAERDPTIATDEADA